MATTPKTPTELTREQQQLAQVLDECCLYVAEIVADAEEAYAETLSRARALRSKLRTVSNMARLGDLPEWRIERRVVKAA